MDNNNNKGFADPFEIEIVQEQNTHDGISDEQIDNDIREVMNDKGGDGKANKEDQAKDAKEDSDQSSDDDKSGDSDADKDGKVSTASEGDKKSELDKERDSEGQDKEALLEREKEKQTIYARTKKAEEELSELKKQVRTKQFELDKAKAEHLATKPEYSVEDVYKNPFKVLEDHYGISYDYLTALAKQNIEGEEIPEYLKKEHSIAQREMKLKLEDKNTKLAQEIKEAQSKIEKDAVIDEYSLHIKEHINTIDPRILTIPNCEQLHVSLASQVYDIWVNEGDSPQTQAKMKAVIDNTLSNFKQFLVPKNDTQEKVKKSETKEKETKKSKDVEAPSSDTESSKLSAEGIIDEYYKSTSAKDVSGA